MPRSLRVLVFLFLVAGSAVGGWFLVRSLQNRPSDNPVNPSNTANGGAKLVVLVVFDQFRGDYLERWANEFGKDGFERIKRDGVWFANCHVPYACTSTAPGHASIATGATPSVHGIVENAWLDRKDGHLVYCVQPSREYALVPPLPANAGKPERGSEIGFSPENLLAPTISDALRTSGKGRVVSLSVKDRAAVLMGGKATNSSSPTVYCFDLRDGKFHTDAYYAGGWPV